MSLVAQLVVNSLITGAIYALVAAGFSLIYNTNKFMHFAHGASVVAAGYLFYSFSQAGFGVIYSLISTVFYSSFLGFAIYFIFYMPLQQKKASSVIMLVTSIALLMLFQNLVQMVFGANVKDLGFNSGESFPFLGAAMTSLQVGMIALSVFLFFALHFFMKGKIGRDMRAVVDSPELASIVGVNSRKVYALSFILGSFLAGVAGILISFEQNLTPSMGTSLMIKGFTGAVVGGINSVPGAIIGSFVVGFAENFGIAVLPSGFKDAISFIILFVFLLFRPNGLFGGKSR